MSRNRSYNATNPFQGDAKKVLCVCSAGLLRSPTAAVVLASPPFNYNTRAAGVETDFALIPVDEVLIEWADEIVCMQERHAKAIRAMTKLKTPIVVLNIPDNFPYRDPNLIELISANYTLHLQGLKKK